MGKTSRTTSGKMKNENVKIKMLKLKLSYLIVHRIEHVCAEYTYGFEVSKYVDV